MSRAKLLFLDAQDNYQVALAALSAILGYQDQQNFQLVDDTNQLPLPSADVQSPIAQALQQRPEVASLSLQVQSAEKMPPRNTNFGGPTSAHSA